METQSAANQRLNKVMKDKGVNTLFELADIIGVSKQNLYDIRNGKCGISKRMADKILTKYPDIDRDWLLGRTPLVSANADNNSSINVEIGSRNNGNQLTPEPEVVSSTIPLIPIDAVAGPIADYTSTGIMASQCERIFSPIAGATCAIRVSGDSMANEYNSGDICFLRRHNPDIYLEWGKVYVLDTENGAVLKKIQKSDKEGVINCISLNPDYTPFELRMGCIYGWYKVMAVMALK